MTFLRRHVKLLTIGAVCAAAGAGASAIATAGAAGTTNATTATTGTNSPSTGSSPARRPAVRRALARRAVQGEVIVATKSGFVTVTFNRGFVQSVNGQQLTIREGTRKATYKTVTLTVPAGAMVRDNGQAASLSQLTDGQRVAVLQGPNRTVVVARTPK